MSDFTKELNIIDFLGIGIPGCTLVLLLIGNNVEPLLLVNYFGSTCSELTRAIILIILGYIVGMLIHEVGDVIEKIMWHIKWLDPKTYAAYAVGAEELSDALNSDRRTLPGTVEKSDKKEKKKKEKNVGGAPRSEQLPAHSSESLSVILSFIILSLFLYCFVFIFLMALEATVRIQDEGTMQTFNSIFSISNYFVVLCFVVATFAALFYIAQSKLRHYMVKIQHVRLQNPYIQTYVSGYGNSSKRILFDGFRVTMRNFLIVIAVINIFSIWKPIAAYQQICGALASPVDNVLLNSNILVLCYIFAVLLMFIRYCHYSFLKYKYSYEDYLKKHIEKPESNTVCKTTSK